MKETSVGKVWEVMRDYEESRREVRETGFPAPVQDPEAPVCQRCKRELEPIEVNKARLCANCETALFGDV